MDRFVQTTKRRRTTTTAVLAAPFRGIPTAVMAYKWKQPSRAVARIPATEEPPTKEMTTREMAEPISKSDDNTERERHLRLLRQFDLTGRYGPVSGLSRRERWERAADLALLPPEQIRRILSGHPASDVEVHEHLWHGIIDPPRTWSTGPIN